MQACGADSGTTPWALQLLKQGTLRTRPPGKGGKAQGHGEGDEGIAQQLGQQQQRGAGLAGLALAADLQGGLVEHGAHLGLEQGQGLGDVGGAENRPLEFLELLAELGIAGGAADGLAQGPEFGLGVLDAGSLA